MIQFGTLYLRIMRHIRLPAADDVDARNDLNRPQVTDGGGGDDDDEETEEEGDDDEALPRQQRTAEHPGLVYDIIYSSSYCVPVLYITFRHLRGHACLPPEGSVYDLLVPELHKQSMHSVGIMGALSLTDHPVTGLPAYFVHPCRTGEAMVAVIAGRQGIRPEDYLLLWAGLVGPSVGLSVPVALAEALSMPR